METKKITGLKKRQQIDKASRTMFLWVVAASVVVSLSLVAAQYLYKQAAFNQKIISAKSEANETLEDNLENAEPLKQEVTKLIANQQLGSVKPPAATEPDANLRVVLDALPTSNDPSALAASFQNAILNRSGVSIERLSSSGASDLGLSVADVTGVPAGPVEMPFSMVLNGNFTQIEAALADMERTIRPIRLNRVVVQGSGDELRATIEGVTYYVPEKSINVTTKKIQP